MPVYGERVEGGRERVKGLSLVCCSGSGQMAVAEEMQELGRYLAGNWQDVVTDLEKNWRSCDGRNKPQVSGSHIWVDRLREEAPDLWGSCRVRFGIWGENVWYTFGSMDPPLRGLCRREEWKTGSVYRTNWIPGHGYDFLGTEYDHSSVDATVGKQELSDVLFGV